VTVSQSNSTQLFFAVAKGGGTPSIAAAQKARVSAGQILVKP
jgi:hypothetical protein